MVQCYKPVLVEFGVDHMVATSHGPFSLNLHAATHCQFSIMSSSVAWSQFSVSNAFITLVRERHHRAKLDLAPSACNFFTEIFTVC